MAVNSSKTDLDKSLFNLKNLILGVSAISILSSGFNKLYNIYIH